MPKLQFGPNADEAEESQLVEFNFYKINYRNKGIVDKALPRLFALSPETSLLQIKRLIADKLRGIFMEMPENDSDLNKMIEIHVK